MSEKEYIVTVVAGTDWDQFNQDMVDSTGAGSIPNRSVDVVNARPGSRRNGHYALTDEEAAQLRNDPRVMAVEIPFWIDGSAKIGLRSSQTGNFTRGATQAGEIFDWAKPRCNAVNLASVPSQFDYSLDGRGVDVVIQDSGIDPNHPEWEDENGNSRLQQINWYTASGLTGTQSANFYGDYDGHGTHVAGTIAGKTFGWAKGAHIYSQKLSGLEGDQEGNVDPGTGISILDAFDTIRLWHNKKNDPNDPAYTGRPTVVNMSWGTINSRPFTTINSINYRGSQVATSYPSGIDFQEWDNYGLPTVVNWIDSDEDTVADTIAFDTISTFINAEIEDMIADGIIVCIAAGNSYRKMDVPGGLDYNNYFTTTLGDTIYYNRPGSPYSANAFNVGAIDSALSSNNLDEVDFYSNRGPAVNINAPGTNIISAMSSNYNTDRYTPNTYHGNANFYQEKIQGTSMASPQVAGLAACILGSRPHLTPEKVYKIIIGYSKSALDVQNDAVNTYRYSKSLLTGPNRMLYNPFNTPTPFVVSGNGLQGFTADMG